MKLLNKSEEAALLNLANRLNVEVIKLKALIDFESGFNPSAVNKYSGAVGLIQFMPKTLRNMGYIDSANFLRMFPTIESQLNTPVYEYFKNYLPLDTDKKLFMSVFYPVASTWPDLKEFPKIVQDSNPGIKTVADYMRKVYSRIGLKYQPAFFFALVSFVAVYYIIKNKRFK